MLHVETQNCVKDKAHNDEKPFETCYSISSRTSFYINILFKL